MNTTAKPYPADVEFSISRTFDAPRDRVWSAWSQADHLAHWWGPKGTTIRVAKLDFKPNGVFHYAMGLPTGSEMWGLFQYREITPSTAFVFINSFSDADGNITRAPFSPTWPLEVLNHVTFDEHDGKTTVTLRGGPIHANSDELQTFKMGHASMTMGFTGTMDQLAAYLAKTNT